MSHVDSILISTLHQKSNNKVKQNKREKNLKVKFQSNGF